MNKKNNIDNSNALIQSYLQSNKSLRNRTITLSVLFLLILGLQHSTNRNDEKRKAYYMSMMIFKDIVNSNDIKRTFDSIIEYRKLAYEIIGSGAISEEQIDHLRYKLEKSNYQDKTPLYETIDGYDAQIKSFGTKSEDYQISVLGTSTSFSDWLYFAPIILLLLYHDMTLTYLHRKKIRDKLKLLKIENWKLGDELFGDEFDEEGTPTQRFMRLITTGFISIMLFLPIIPAILGIVSYASENSYMQTQAFMVVIQWLCAIIMVIEMMLIYYTENLLGINKLVNWLKFWQNRPITFFDLIFSVVLSCIIMGYYGMISYLFSEVHNIDIFLVLTLFLTILPYPLSIFLLRKNLGKYKGFRFVGRLMLFYWVFMFVLFIASEKIVLSYPRTMWIGGAWIFLIASICAAIIYVWVYNKNSNQDETTVNRLH